MAGKEDQLYETKWFDYRLLTPDQATLLFIRYWWRAHRFLLEKLYGYVVDEHGGHSEVEEHELFDANNITLDEIQNRFPSELDTFTRLRRFADSRGFNYETFWFAAAHVLLHYYLPKDISLERYIETKDIRILSNVIFKNNVLDKIDEDGIISPSHLCYFMAQHWHDEELQNQYYEYLVESVVKGRAPAMWYRLLRTWISDGWLSQEFLEAYHPDVLAEITARIY